MIRTVQDLIDSLSDFDPDAPVYIASGSRMVTRYFISDVDELGSTQTADNGKHNGGVHLFEGSQHQTFPYVQRH